VSRTAVLGSRQRPRRAVRIDRCRVCGSDALWGAHFDEDGLATTTDGPGVDYLVSCSSCGEFYLVGEGAQ
jgi:hypothetical protein